jgi:hypothetical protein
MNFTVDRFEYGKKELGCPLRPLYSLDLTSGRSHRPNETFTASYPISIDRERCYIFQFLKGFDIPSRKRS